MPEQTTFDGLLEAVPDALIGVDPSGAIRFVNHHAETLFGYDRDELVGQPIETLVPESHRDTHVAQRQGYFSGPLARSMGSGLDLTGRHRDGTEIPVDISLSHLDTVDGPLVIASVRDMSERKKAEAGRLRAERMSAVVEFSGEAILSSTLDGIITSYNRAAEKVFGYTTEELVGKPASVLSPKDHTGEARTILARIGTGQPVMDFETIRVRKDGTVFPVSLTVSPIFDHDGTVVGASTITQDVTNQKQAQYARSLIEAGLDPLVTISPEGKITDVNEATIKVTGVPREELIGTDFSDYFTEPDKAQEGYQLAFERGSVTDYPLTMRHRDGTLTEVLYNAAVYRDSGGKVLGLFAAARDVTETKLAQAELAKQSKELDRLAELERFQRLTVGRELKMIELKKEIESLRRLVQTDEGESGDQR